MFCETQNARIRFSLRPRFPAALPRYLGYNSPF
jgi:hypothetical protein